MGICTVLYDYSQLALSMHGVESTQRMDGGTAPGCPHPPILGRTSADEKPQLGATSLSVAMGF